ncbi:SDR family NAD(P)-dependent oxidoreductase [Tuwongella immobilis]|uniref:3-oxoacyl-ACP reductase n=1 Tax=Tuwongella immobilis TaxID=692036 RepID=A0A6C2YLT1_9BACT|nr:SDR family NAD(P)-dependent oxidoreductase [Tuwongella immobilis]VIP02540.1 3-oxoacyl-acp reductase : Short-chain dehydrogenase/reductase SDR OS=Chthoniobacter flavus Ellin428 GN=CfE428DRAFT_2806 PE=3 SV=1: adh_short [Tuwongella immobilis]VTS01709.1 3-oxoacyl-acp reductase : Short-chain dehydrogenase/reductase SDR OS=Chthoniobacter flavus Ellin428 GN=CfE428DRAFT_2806 PE=3 SV=1: adh_short [Tuwongella immobilis]
MNQVDLKGRVAIVTGGARGIGYAILQRLMASGAKGVIWDRDATAIASATASLSSLGEVHGVEVDITSADSVGEAVKSTLGRFGTIDILVNNAGIAGANKKAWEYTPEEWRLVIDIDLTGVFLCCRAVVPVMLEKQYGRIVNIASVAGKEGNPNASHYSAAKAGVIGFTKSLGKELATSGVIVNAVTPAVIETDILKQLTQAHIDYMLSKIPMGRFGKTNEAAAMVAWLSSEDCSFTTASVFDLSGGRATY